MDVFISVLLRLCWASESPGELDELTVGSHPRVSDSAGLLQGPRICISNELPFHAVKSVLNTHWKHWCWSWNSNTLATDVKNWLTGKHPDMKFSHSSHRHTHTHTHTTVLTAGLLISNILHLYSLFMIASFDIIFVCGWFPNLNCMFAFTAELSNS